MPLRRGGGWGGQLRLEGEGERGGSRFSLSGVSWRPDPPSQSTGVFRQYPGVPAYSSPVPDGPRLFTAGGAWIGPPQVYASRLGVGAVGPHPHPWVRVSRGPGSRRGWREGKGKGAPGGDSAFLFSSSSQPRA